MTPCDNSRTRRPAENREPRAASPALDRVVLCLATAPALAACSSHSSLAARNQISNRHIPRLEMYLTPVKSACEPVLIATKRDMRFSSLSLAFLPSREGGRHKLPLQCRRQSQLGDILADFAARFSNAEYTGDHPKRDVAP
jgi:hypothetical protein